MKKISILFLLLSTFGYAKESTINVTGNGSVNTSPDMVKIISSVETEGESSKETNEKNKTIIHNILTALEKNGIKKSSIKIENYSVNFRTNFNSEKKEKKYYVSNQIIIDSKNLDKTSTILEVLNEYGVSQINSVDFYLKDKEKIEKEAYRLAYLDAKNKAQNIADLENFKLYPKEIQLNNYYRQPIFYKAAADSKGKELPLTIPQKIEIPATVNVVFYLEK